MQSHDLSSKIFGISEANLDEVKAMYVSVQKLVNLLGKYHN